MTQGLPSLLDLETRRSQMFPKVSAAQLARVRRLGVEKTFEPGQIVFDQGDDDVPFYVVLDGEMEIVHPERGREDLITIHHANEFTGEMNLLSDRRSLVRARARTNLRVLRFEHAQLRTLIQTDSEISELLMRAFILRRVGLLTSVRETWW